MKKLAIMMLMFASSLAAQSYSGIWNGVGGKVDARYGIVPQTAQMTLLQAGTSLKGTLKIGTGTPIAINSGTVSGTQLTFVVGKSGAQITATLSQNGAQLKGQMTASNGMVFNFVFTQAP